MPTERRAHPRFPLILAVQYAGADTVLDCTENLSGGGLFIRTERDFAAGERVTLVVSFPQLLAPVELEVEVVRWRAARGDAPAGVAVRVPEDRTADRARLAEVAAIVAASRGPAPAARILLVEDNALVAAIYTAALHRLADEDGLGAFAIEVASGGADAFARLVREPAIDAVVTDLFMPEMSGVALVERIRAEPSIAHVPVVVVTSAGDAERARVEALGVAACLRKPVSYDQLARVVRTVVGRGVPRGERGLTDDTGVTNHRSDAMPAYRR